MTDLPTEPGTCSECGKFSRHTVDGKCITCRNRELGPAFTFGKKPSPPLDFEIIDANSTRQENGCRNWDGVLSSARQPIYWDSTRAQKGKTSSGYVNVRRWVVEQAIGRTLAKNEIAVDTCENNICVELLHLQGVKRTQTTRTLVGRQAIAARPTIRATRAEWNELITLLTGPRTTVAVEKWVRKIQKELNK